MKALESYFQKQASTIHLLMDQESRSFTADTFHQLRVEIKRVKALVDLIAFCSKKWNPKKTFKPFKVIFKQAGKVREIQLQLALLEEQPSFNSLKGCRKHYKKKLKRALEKFFTVTNSGTSGKLRKKHRIIIARFLQIGKKKQRRYMAVKRQEIKKMLRQNTIKKKQIHTFRIRLKVYDYNEKIMKYPEQNKGIAARNRLMELLGHWHDFQVSILQIKKATRNCASDSNEIELLENIKSTFISKRNVLYDQINTALKQQHFLDAEKA
ncbi:CHAD domain-containing protein [Flavobacterium caseinilyticum]|uniref:CHAD domain-containing protein n=1 Tax=Flavobacterium caseinilyticum TaxID=2541732 RepID=A0A4R5AXS6_9FLAO|nr:CHAD domain-containing protein [Flavobacterium caseinilyticum]TDD76004.1 CHAD domain-containing protein [Flavobacterium caseinilyticum]